MLGRMQEWPLLMHKIIDFAAIQFPDREVASRMVEGPMHRTNYQEIRDRALKVAKRLERDGIKLGDRVATLAWNGFRHLEAWYGITGVGAIYHTVNPRLFPEQIAWIINHAEDRMVMTDLTFVPLLEAIADHLPTVERYIVLSDGAHMPATRLKNAIAYEDWIGEVDSDFKWKDFDERTAAGLCYTSGTTGNPKGVLYSHRSNILHSMMATGPEVLTLNAYDSVLPVVPMFHANSWGLALACLTRGARMVMPGAKLDGASVYDILETEKVTMTAAVPTVWLGLLQYMRKENKRLTTLKFVGIGGSACPPEMIRAFAAQAQQLATPLGPRRPASPNQHPPPASANQPPWPTERWPRPRLGVPPRPRSVRGPSGLCSNSGRTSATRRSGRTRMPNDRGASHLSVRSGGAPGPPRPAARRPGGGGGRRRGGRDRGPGPRPERGRRVPRGARARRGGGAGVRAGRAAHGRGVGSGRARVCAGAAPGRHRFRSGSARRRACWRPSNPNGGAACSGTPPRVRQPRSRASGSSSCPTGTGHRRAVRAAPAPAHRGPGLPRARLLAARPRGAGAPARPLGPDPVGRCRRLRATHPMARADRAGAGGRAGPLAARRARSGRAAARARR